MKVFWLRLLSIVFVLIALYLLIIMRLFYWQVIKSEDIKEIGRRQSTESLVLQSKRGEILSSDNFPLATNKTTHRAFANPKLIKDKNSISKELSIILNKDEATISALLESDLYWVSLAMGINDEKKKQIDALEIQGLGFQSEDARLYPEASMAAHLIGFVGKDLDGEDKGYFGLEGFYNAQLEGRQGRTYVVKDALGNQILSGIREESKIDGRNIILNIDRTIQYLIEKRLKEGIEKYQAEGGSVVVMEPKTGKVLGLASLPKFNPQTYYQYESKSYKDPIVSSLYEPGSTFKVLVMAAGIDLGVVKPETKCDICKGLVKIGEYSIKTWNDKYFPDSTMTEVIQHSDNIGMVFVERKIGIDNLLKYLNVFGISQKTGIDLQGEVSGSIKDKSNLYPIDAATLSFGQGISITPIQLLTAVSSIANGGNLMKPYVVNKIISDDGKIYEVNPEVKRKTVSQNTAKIITWMMVNAVEQGEAKWAKLKDYKIAGKTGTAQIPVAGHYDPNNTITSFVGFFPAQDPKISMLVLINKPKVSIYGSETAAPIFFSIARDLVGYLNIPPSF
ncbi:penicillin-binding protein 2 [Candidatus Parcubacteria bacterium]|nr:MAG: penicillin-binding protein 2 [Candidatus Parcubacteria bacterium]